jgi:hypothetical protein
VRVPSSEVAVPWDFIIAMPAVSLPRAVDAGNTAVVPFADLRYQELIAAEPHVRTFLGSFRTAFGHQLQPAIVIRERGPERIQAEDLAALRNMIALSAVIRARTDRSVHRFGGQGPAYADLFELYPVNLAVDRRTVMVQTGAEFGMDDALERFQGQPHPAYIYPQNVTPAFDDVLLVALVALWQSRPAGEDEPRFRRRVFRSLESTYRALASPLPNLGSQYDHALGLALWVSAFEILTDRGDRDSVERLILAVPWLHRELRDDLILSVRQPPHDAPVTRPIQTCQRLYRVRNESLHGDAISTHLVTHRHGEQEEDPIETPVLRADEWNHLAVAVPALYRAVLLELLTQKGFHTRAVDPGVDDLDAYGDFIEGRFDSRHYEKPLLHRSRLRR